MPTVTKTIVVPAKGIGRPDFSGEQWQAKIVKRLEIHEKEALKRFGIVGTVAPLGPYAWVRAPLAVGVPTNLIDTDTGVPMPFTVPAGYTFEIMLMLSSFNQNQRIFTELGLPPFLPPFLLAEVYNDAMHVYYENEVVGLDTKYIDPDGLFAHTITYGGTNVGIAAMSGSAEVIGILHSLHTEIPTSKTIRCKWCGNTTSVANEVVRWKCTKCGKETLYFHCPSALDKGRR